jgi:hypothetical protein
LRTSSSLTVGPLLPLSIGVRPLPSSSSATPLFTTASSASVGFVLWPSMIPSPE